MGQGKNRMTEKEFWDMHVFTADIGKDLVWIEAVERVED